MLVSHPGEEPDRPLEPLPDGAFRVGEAWSPSRLAFDALVEGRATRAVLGHQVFYRAFTS